MVLMEGKQIKESTFLNEKEKERYKIIITEKEIKIMDEKDERGGTIYTELREKRFIKEIINYILKKHSDKIIKVKENDKEIIYLVNKDIFEKLYNNLIVIVRIDTETYVFDKKMMMNISYFEIDKLFYSINDISIFIKKF